jgi:hypothetical protein
MSCYAIHLGNCAGGRSKEHYISESVLEIAGTAIQISGFPWQRAGETAHIGAASLAAKMLCRRHNEQLSPLDSVGKDFLAGLKSSFHEASEGRFSNRTYQIRGKSLELWLLKVLCGVLRLRRIAVPEEWIDILFQRKPWPDGTGMHILVARGEAAWYFTLVRVTLVEATEDPTQIRGAKFGIGGLAMLLAFGTPRLTEPGVQTIFRPGSILIETDGKRHQHVLSWDDDATHASVVLEFIGPIEEPATAPRPIVKPVR